MTFSTLPALPFSSQAERLISLSPFPPENSHSHDEASQSSQEKSSVTMWSWPRAAAVLMVPKVTCGEQVPMPPKQKGWTQHKAQTTVILIHADQVALSGWATAVLPLESLSVKWATLKGDPARPVQPRSYVCQCSWKPEDNLGCPLPDVIQLVFWDREPLSFLFSLLCRFYICRYMKRIDTSETRNWATKGENRF